MNRTCVLAVVFVAVALMGASCGDGYRGESSDPCKCPTLVETAPTIDFVGDGQTPIDVRSNWVGDPRPLVVGLVYDIPSSGETVIEIAERLIDAGFETETALELPLRNSPRFVDDEWEVVIGGTGSGGSIRIVVSIVEPDRDAARALAPLMDALGTVP